MLVHSYNEHTLQYENTNEAYFDPIENKVLVPKNSTTAELPVIQADEVAVYNKTRKKWETIKDHRGAWYDIENGQEVRLDYIYDTSLANTSNLVEHLAQRVPYAYEFKVITLQDGRKIVRENPHNHYSGVEFKYLEWSFTERMFVLKADLKDVVERLKEVLKTQYNQLITSNFVYKDHEYQTDNTSLNLLQMKLIMLQSINMPIAWVTAENQIAMITAEDIMAIITGLQVRNQNIFMIYQELKKELETIDSYEDLNNLIDNWVSVVKNGEIISVFVERCEGLDLD